MKFNSILRTLIKEASRFEVLMDKFVNTKKNSDKKPFLKKIELLKLIAADPTTRLNDVNLGSDKISKEDMSKVKVGIYTPWIIKNYLRPKTELQYGEYGYDKEVVQIKDRFMEDLYKVTDDLKKFHRFKYRLAVELRDINKLSVDDLYDAVKDFDLIMATTSKAERKNLPVHPGAESVFDGDTWKVVKIKDKGEKAREAACFYGGGPQEETRWCTAAAGGNRFDYYIKDGPLYIVYNPNDTRVAPSTGLPVDRYQFHFPSNQFMDKDDRSIDLVQWLNGPMEELKQYFKPEFAKGLTIRGEKLEIDGFNSGSIGKFIGLYGLDELFDALPDDLNEININGRGQATLVVPPSIGKFKNLEALVLINCIDYLPEQVCELKNLKFLTLQNNPRLRTIPDCIDDLPALIFLNAKESDNLEIPRGILDRGTLWDTGLWEVAQ